MAMLRTLLPAILLIGILAAPSAFAKQPSVSDTPQTTQTTSTATSKKSSLKASSKKSSKVAKASTDKKVKSVAKKNKTAKVTSEKKKKGRVATTSKKSGKAATLSSSATQSKTTSSDSSKSKNGQLNLAAADGAQAFVTEKKNKKGKVKKVRERRRGSRMHALRQEEVDLPQSTANLPNAVQRALSAMIGTPYRLGGESQNGIDCSGFVRQVLGPAGCDLPRTSSEQAQMGKHVSVNELKPGDLLFFSTRGRGRISHVGIYLGQNKMAHASPNKGVVVASVQEPYFQNRYVTARRILSMR